tara:strand:+ start:19464 stop:20279 length:816 start_codon:yes stop_codon:yes gene_type:complete
MTIQTLPINAITSTETKLVTNTFKVAEAFSKRHRDIIKKINLLECSASFLTANFCAVKYNHRGNVYDTYEMSKDGFMFLVMGFTGKKAAQIKEAYINAFNAMADKLSELQYGTLTHGQQRQIQTKISTLVNSQPRELHQSLYNTLYNKLKSHFNVTKYEQIPAHLFNQALAIVDQFKLAAPQYDAVIIDLPKSGIIKSTQVSAFNYGDTLLPTPMAALLNQLMQAEQQNKPVLVNNVRTAAKDLDGLLGLLQQYNMMFKQITALTEPSRHI